MTAWRQQYGRTISRQQRRRILNRDRHTCQICGHPGADTVDHIKPKAEGGTDEDDNLQAVHQSPCHDNKTKAEQARGRQRGWVRRNPKRPPEPHPSLKGWG